MLLETFFHALPGNYLAFVVPAALVGYWVAWIIYARTLHPLSHIPGPFGASVSRFWIMWRTTRGDMEHTQRSLHKKYGPLVRIAPNEIACADPNAIKKIYRTSQPLRKTDFYPIWGNKTFSKYADNFSGTDEQLHSERRRIVNHVYSLSNVLQFETFIDRCSELFMTRFGELADGVQVIDLGEWLQWYAFDVVGELFFGHMFGFLENAHDHESYIESLDTLVPAIITAALAPTYLRPIILTSAILNPAARRALKAIDHIAAAARSCVAERRAKTIGDDSLTRHDLLYQLLGIVQEKGEKVDFGIPEVEYEAYVALFAGSDTTAIAMRACLYFLMKNPKEYQKVQAEIDEAVAKGELHLPVKYAEATKLPLLCAAIKEAMRLHPSVGLTMPRVVPAGGMDLCGMHIAQGYRVGMNAAVVGYNEEVYGPDASDFRPGRWLEGDAANMEKHLLVFGGGTRTCIGKNISLSEIHKLLPQLLWRYELCLAVPVKPWTTSNFWFNKQTGIEVKIRARS